MMQHRPRTAVLGPVVFGPVVLGPILPGLVAVGLGAAAAGGVRWLVHGEHVDDATGLALTAAVLVGLTFALVALVRAAARGFKRRDGGLALRLAGALPPLALLGIGALFAQATLVDASVAMEALIGGDEASPPTLVVGPTGADVRLAGEITAGTADRLEALLAAHPRVGRIHLTSDGGLADEGEALGAVIAAHGLTTFVPDYCVSACTLAFARGRERLAMDDARLGYHAPYEQGLFGAMYRDDATGPRAAYLAAGIAPAFVRRALSTDPADIWMPSQAELLGARVVTAIVDHDTLPDSNLDGAATEAGAAALVLRSVPLLRPLAKRRPAAMAAIARWYLDGYRRGRSEGENTRGLRLLVRGVVASALVHADAAVVRDAGHLLARSLGSAADPAACARIAGEGDLAEAAAQLKDDGATAEAADLLDRALRDDVAAVAVPPIAPVAAATPGAPCSAVRRDFVAMLAAPGGARTLRARLAASVPRSLSMLPQARFLSQPPAPRRG